jgi:hypothetical protein
MLYTIVYTIVATRLISVSNLWEDIERETNLVRATRIWGNTFYFVANHVNSGKRHCRVRNILAYFSSPSNLLVLRSRGQTPVIGLSIGSLYLLAPQSIVAE